MEITIATSWHICLMPFVFALSASVLKSVGNSAP